MDRDLSDPDHTAYQKRNYNIKTPLTFDGYNVHGFATKDEELRHLIVTDSSTDLWVFTIGLKYISRYSKTIVLVLLWMLIISITWKKRRKY